MRGQAGTLEALKDVENRLPFPLLGLDSDNGGEFLNDHVLGRLQKRERPVLMTRSRPYKKDDNAHVEQKNWTHIRQWFGYERHDNHRGGGAVRGEGVSISGLSRTTERRLSPIYLNGEVV